MGLTVFSLDPLPADVKKALLRLSRAPDVIEVAAMPDVHLAKDVCVGAVVATSRTLYPAAVGGDIGCGMAAVRLEGGPAEIDEAQARAIFDRLQQLVPILRRAAQSLSAHLERPLSHPSLERKRRIAKEQIGTLGRGNHFVELQSDGEHLWLMVHTGSRGIGQAIRDHHGAGFVGIDAESDAGRAYLADMEWALDYAEENRRWILEAAADALELEADRESLVTCHHNHVRRESAGWVHRKGAISAHEGEPGIIPGSMGTSSHHVVGRGNAASLCSSSHGAGRALSRTEARRRTTVREFQRQMRGIWYDERIASRLVDEAPGAYKDLGKVMRAQRKLTKIVRTVSPLLVYKG